MNILRNRLSPTYRGGFAPRENITLNVHADGESNGDMSLEEAFDFIRSRGYPKSTYRQVNLSPSIILQESGFFPASITLNLYEGRHSLSQFGFTFSDINVAVIIEGPVDSNGDPLAIIGSGPFVNDSDPTFAVLNNCRCFAFAGVEIDVFAVFAVDTNIAFNPKQLDFGGWEASPIGAKKVNNKATIIGVQNSYIVAAFSDTAPIGGRGGAYLQLENCSIVDYSNSVLISGIAELSINSSLVMNSPDFSGWGNGQAVGFSPVFKADVNSSILLTGGGLSVPSTGGADGVDLRGMSKMLVRGDIDWNGRTIGATAGTTLDSQGCFYNVTGTETP
jgi:hypothetical protein